jgi:hypothetical protein
MPRTTYHRTADGQMVDETTATDDRGIIKSGFTMRTKLTMMDSIPAQDVGPLHRPGSIAMSDAEHDAKVAAIIAGNARLSDAWRNPAPLATPSKPVTSQPAPLKDGTVDMDAVYERNDKRLEDAWKQTA